MKSNIAAIDMAVTKFNSYTILLFNLIIAFLLQLTIGFTTGMKFDLVSIPILLCYGILI